MKPSSAAVLAAAIAVAPPLQGDEGMWTLDNLPGKILEERYNFVPDADWLEHVRLASVRFNDGGSGSFVSDKGLVLTNHHVALGQLQKVSSEKADFVRDGFFAKKASDELKCPDLEVNVLMSMEEVTKRVLDQVDEKAPAKEQNDARKAAMAKIEKESTDSTGLRSDVVELYRGGEYWLYRYKKFTDVRLVMAPESAIAFFGGDPDNFTFPRYDLDFAFFRIYDKGKPVAPDAYFRWSSVGALKEEMVFVTGHPGSTDRLKTLSQLAYQRDHALPTALKSWERRRKALYAYSEKGEEQARRAKDKIFGIENALKAKSGELAGLKDPALMARKAGQEKDLRRALGAREDLKDYDSAFANIAQAQEALVSRHKEMNYRRVGGSKLAEFATTIVRYTAEVEKPNEKRFEEYRDSALESLNHRLFSPAPIYPDLEEAMLTDILAESFQELGPDDEHVKAALGGRTPAKTAAGLIAKTQLADPAARKALIEGGRGAVEATKDPLIVWARLLDPSYRELRKWYEDTVQSVEALEGNRVAKARFGLYGKSAYPDATFTLRLSYGKVLGYNQGTNNIPHKTTYWGLFERSVAFNNAAPYELPAKVAAAKGKLDLDTALNIVTTNDIIGGNSGSPVINREGHVVGLIFDGNIQSLVGRYFYDDSQNRAVAVATPGIMEALTKIYGMKALAKELEDAASAE